MWRPVDYLTICIWLIVIALLTGCEEIPEELDSNDVASIILTVDAATMGSGGNNSVNLTAILKNSSNILLEDVSVNFIADGGGLSLVSPTTDANGQATATLSTAGDTNNRTITITAEAGTKKDSVAIEIVGTTISVSGESSLVFNNSTVLTILLQDSDLNAISETAVAISSSKGNVLSTNSVITNAIGQATFTLTGTVNGIDTITVSALGAIDAHTVNVSSDQFSFSSPLVTDLLIGVLHSITVNWSQSGSPVADGNIVNFSVTRGTLSANSAVTSGGSASVTVISNNAGPVLITAFVNSGPSASIQRDYIATTPAFLIFQADRATIGNNGEQTVLTAIVRDAQQNLVKNVNVRFTIIQDVSGGSISQSTDTTDALGRASTVYTSSSATTAKDGVQINVEVENNSAIADTIFLTVAQDELFLRLGTSNLLSELNSVVYSKTMVALVTDAAGNAVENAEVTLSVIPTFYGKGVKIFYVAGWVAVSSINSNLGPDPCPNEDTIVVDTALNGILDQGEDINSNSNLDPGNVVAVTSSATTDQTGYAIFDITYAKDFCSWITVKVIASSLVAGTEGVDELSFLLSCLADDVNDASVSPPGGISPMGSGASCADPN